MFVFVLLCFSLVYWADVVEATAGDEVARGGVSAGHHPGGAQGDRVHLFLARIKLVRIGWACQVSLGWSGWSGSYFVGGVGVPDDEFSILRGRNQVSRVRSPMHSIHLQSEVYQDKKWQKMKKPWTSVPGGFCASSSVSARLAPCSPLPSTTTWWWWPLTMICSKLTITFTKFQLTSWANHKVVGEKGIFFGWPILDVF